MTPNPDTYETPESQRSAPPAGSPIPAVKVSMRSHAGRRFTAMIPAEVNETFLSMLKGIADVTFETQITFSENDQGQQPEVSADEA